MSWNAGFGILNNANFAITFGCSIAATDYYENDVQPGEIFYRWPGAVWMTLFARPTTDKTRYTNGKCAWEIARTTALAALTPTALMYVPVLAGAGVMLAPIMSPIIYVGTYAAALALTGAAAIDVVRVKSGAWKTDAFLNKFQSSLITSLNESEMYVDMKGC